MRAALPPLWIRRPEAINLGETSDSFGVLKISLSIL
jgi:hypothetical protein